MRLSQRRASSILVTSRLMTAAACLPTCLAASDGAEAESGGREPRVRVQVQVHHLLAPCHLLTPSGRTTRPGAARPRGSLSILHLLSGSRARLLQPAGAARRAVHFLPGPRDGRLRRAVAASLKLGPRRKRSIAPAVERAHECYARGRWASKRAPHNGQFLPSKPHNRYARARAKRLTYRIRHSALGGASRLAQRERFNSPFPLASR